jgi:hypothetical protein
MVETVVIAAPGPSLTFKQVELVRQNRTKLISLTIGDVGRAMFTDANILYHCDKKWWDYYQGCPDFEGLKYSLEQTDYPEIIKLERSERQDGFDLQYPKIVTGYNSGYQAINLSLYFKPKRIILIGYDLKEGPNGEHNIIGDHPKDIKRPCNFKLFGDKIKTLVPVLDSMGITVYNCSIETSLDCFPRKNLEDVL